MIFHPPKKVAFIHFAKAAGRYINHYLQEQVFERMGSELAVQKYKTFNSWLPPFSLGRDWNEQELLQLAGNRHPTQYPAPSEVKIHYQYWGHEYLSHQYVHNHHLHWSVKTVQHFRDQGWFLFMFLREPGDLLCSFWTWVQKELSQGKEAQILIQPAWLAELSLDEFICTMLTQQEFQFFYALPEYCELLHFTAEFNQKNFTAFLNKYFNHLYCSRELDIGFHFASGNPGYAAYRKQGFISDAADKMLNENKEVHRVREWLASSSKGKLIWHDKN